MSWAKSVLPMFTGDSSETLRIAPDQVQIDTAHFRPQAPAKSALSRTRLAVNRTAVIRNASWNSLWSTSACSRLFLLPSSRSSSESDCSHLANSWPLCRAFLLILCSDRFNQRRIIIACPRTVNPLRHRPLLQHVFGRWLHQRRRILSVPPLPLLEVVRFENDRHPVVHLSGKLIRFGNDHRARVRICAGRLVRPFGPQAGNRDYLTICLLYTSPSPRDGLLSRMPS